MTFTEEAIWFCQLRASNLWVTPDEAGISYLAFWIACDAADWVHDWSSGAIYGCEAWAEAEALLQCEP